MIPYKLMTSKCFDCIVRRVTMLIILESIGQYAFALGIERSTNSMVWKLFKNRLKCKYALALESDAQQTLWYGIEFEICIGF